MGRVYLVRHATHDLVGKVLAGRLPGVPLSEQGLAQAAALAAHLGAVASIGAVLSSPMERCLQTAAPLAAALGLTVEATPALNEIDCGVWTGQRFEDLAGDDRWRAWNSERGRTTVPGGESAQAVLSRARTLVQTFASPDRTPAVLVTHSDVIKFVMLDLLGASLDLHDRLEIDAASVTTLDLWPGGGKIVRSNEAVAA